MLYIIIIFNILFQLIRMQLCRYCAITIIFNSIKFHLYFLICMQNINIVPVAIQYHDTTMYEFFFLSPLLHCELDCTVDSHLNSVNDVVSNLIGN